MTKRLVGYEIRGTAYVGNAFYGFDPEKRPEAEKKLLQEFVEQAEQHLGANRGSYHSLAQKVTINVEPVYEYDDEEEG